MQEGAMPSLARPGSSWKADPKDIIAAAKRGHQTLETIH